MAIVMLMTCDKLDEVPCDDVSKEGERLEELSWVGSRHETQGEDGGEMVGLGSMRQGRREGGPPFHDTTFFFQHSNIIINIEIEISDMYVNTVSVSQKWYRWALTKPFVMNHGKPLCENSCVTGLGRQKLRDIIRIM